jgi:hypothetical protein
MSPTFKAIDFQHDRITCFAVDSISDVTQIRRNVVDEPQRPFERLGGAGNRPLDTARRFSLRTEFLILLFAIVRDAKWFIRTVSHAC